MTVPDMGDLRVLRSTDEETQMNSGGVNPFLSSQIYTREYYFEICGGHKEFEDDGIAQRLLKAIDYARIEPGIRVLDIGCGRGELARDCFGQGCEVWAIDYSLDALNQAKQRIMHPGKTSHSDWLYLYQMNSTSLTLPDDTFNRVFMIDIVEQLYLRELNTTIREAKRGLRPGERLVIHTETNIWLIEQIYFPTGNFIGWERHPSRINGQNYCGLLEVLAQVGESVEVKIEKVPGFFRLGPGSEGKRRRNLDALAKLQNVVFDSRLASWLIQSTPLSCLFGTDLWGIADALFKGKGI